jgi:hypothetical protein
MISDKAGEGAVADLITWANGVARSADPQVTVDVYHDADSSTYVLRLVKGDRVLLFRFSEAQVHTSEREQECARTLRRKIKDLANLI